jgi:hypothetical protein
MEELSIISIVFFLLLRISSNVGALNSDGM